MNEANVELAKKAGDYIAGGMTLATLFQFLPHMTAALAFIWWLFRIYELKTVQRFLRKWRVRR